MKEIILNERQLSDFELIVNESFYPVKGFMNKNDYEGVVNDMYLSTGEFFPIPIVLAISKEKSLELINEKKVFLKTETNIIVGVMNVDNIYKPDFENESLKVFGADITEINHPYIKLLNEYKQKNMFYIGGNFENILKSNIYHYDFKEYRLSPFETKKWFKENGWDKVIGFTCRNPLHKSHYHLTKYALNQVPDSKLFLNPVVGITQTEDIDYFTRVKCYKHILKYYELDTVKLNLLNLNQRMAGGRDALFMSLIRKNYGCTHFVIGRDFSGPSSKKFDGTNFYLPYEAQEMLSKYSDKIGIIPIFSKEIVYAVTDDDGDGEFIEIDKVVDSNNTKIMNISGTKLRKMLKNNEDIPSWFSFKEVINELKLNNQLRKGLCIYFVGLSASGKSTMANFLISKIKEVSNKPVTLLDGDIIRNNISKGLGFSKEDISINVRRIGFVASEIVKHQGIVIVSNIAPFEKDRLYNRELISQFGNYVEVFVNTPIEICENRDNKGLYKKAKNNEITNFAGISFEFEEPVNEIDTVIINGQNEIIFNLNIVFDKIQYLLN